MNPNSLITLEELLGWRELDRWRREKGFRELHPHQGFHGIRPIVGCNCCTCATKWHMKDEERVEKHNAKVEGPLKQEFVRTWVQKNGSTSGSEWNWSQHYTSMRVEQTTNSLSRAKILRDVVKIVRFNPLGTWSELLLQEKEKEDLDFVKKLMRLIGALLGEEIHRTNEQIELSKPAFEDDWGLRRYVPIGKPKKKWVE